ncbi:sensor histidine kinase [Gorillibacterium massiliense]|uniref:sensor histidine kinase n=1 Tax=Gorillibacterium massiliense TaxID=1280390 RepID=UPI0004B5E4E4|nr:HAMP domain-containing sensor histidine kinase [Gorillibacterium massiliense]
MGDMLRSFRAKMVALFGWSMVISGIVTYTIYRILQHYYKANVLAEDPLARYRELIHQIGDLNFFLILFLPLSFIIFFFLTKRYVDYFKEISEGIHRLAGGDFNGQVRIASGDEFEDIATDINLAAEKLRLAVERGDFAETSKDQLVLNLAHDLRTPLTSVLGYLDFILRDKGLSEDQIRHYAAVAFAKSERLQKLIEELFEVTRMNSGRLPVDKKAIDLSELLAQLNEELYPVFEKNHLTVRTDIAPQMTIWADGDLLARVFENLLTNAARYGKDGRYVDLNCRMDGRDAVVEVVNYGNLIPEEELPHLFDMFYTGDRARTHREGSTGLGLFIAKNIVDRHEGTISVESSVISTRFQVRLPVNGKA